MSGLHHLASVRNGIHLGRSGHHFDIYGYSGYPLEADMGIFGKVQHLSFIYSDEGQLEKITNGNGTRLAVTHDWYIPLESPYPDQVALERGLAIRHERFGPTRISGMYGGEPAMWDINYWTDGTVSKVGMQFGEISLLHTEFCMKGNDRVAGRQMGMDTGIELVLPEDRLYLSGVALYPVLLSLL